MNNKFKCGMYLGRFQPIHIGHMSVIDKMLDECDTVVIVIGSAQERGTERNPLNFIFRRRLIRETYWGRLHRIRIIPMYDRDKYSDDSSWGKHLLNAVKLRYTLEPDAIYEGDDSVNTHWYDECDISIVKVPRTHIPISGTDLRKAIIANDKSFVLEYLPKQIHKYYDEIRKEIQNGKTDY